MSRLARCLAVLVALALAALAAPAGADPVDPLRGQWHLDTKVTSGAETTPDSSGNGLDASASTITLESPGKWGANLAPSNGSILNAGSSPQLAPDRVTLMAWVKHYGTPPTLGYIAGKGGQGPAQGCVGSSYALYTGYPGNPGLFFYVRTTDGVGPLSANGSSTVWDGNWHLVVGTYDGTSVRLYVDGAAVGAPVPVGGSGEIGYALSSNDFTIDGYAEPSCGAGNFAGGIDEVRVYGRALSASEIARLTASSPSPPNLDLVDPQTSITGGPADNATLAGEKAVFQFASSEPGSTFQCRIWNPDTQSPPAFTACTSPFTAPDPTKPDVPELKTFEVRAVDAAGNVDATPESRVFSTDNRLAKDPPAKLKCDEVRIVSGQGKLVHNGCRIAPVTKGKVRCVHGLKMTVKDCRFTTKSGAFVTDATGKRWALVGQAISRSGKKGGKYLTASPIEDKNRVPCGDVPNSVLRAVHGKDAAGQYSGANLNGACVGEKYLVGYNYGGPLQNVATRPICTSSYPHPETVYYGVPITEAPVPAGMPQGTHCYIGKGAGLNDPTGRDRDKNGYYLTGAVTCHQTVVGSGQYATGVIVAKRPSTSVGSNGQVRVDTPIVWRPVSPIPIAN